MNVRIQGVLVTSSYGVTKYLAVSHLKEERLFWLMVFRTTVHDGGQYMAVPYCMAGEYVVAAYTSVPNWESRTKAYNSSLLSPADELVPMCKGFPDSQGVDTSQWRM